MSNKSIADSRLFITISLLVTFAIFLLMIAQPASADQSLNIQPVDSKTDVAGPPSNGAAVLEVPSSTQASFPFYLAPLNPEFVQYQKTQLKTYMLSSDMRSGLVPPPVDLSYLKGQQISQVTAATGSYPSYYSLIDDGRVTRVKDQGSSGSCWAFATYASLESTLLPSEYRDFSENNLKNTHGFDMDPNTGGGSHFVAAAYLTRWSGPVNESDDIYNPLSTTSVDNLPVQKHVQDIFFIPGRSSSSDNNNIKWAIMNYGAVYSTIFYNSNDCTPYGTHPTAYYYSGGPNINHAIAIVGWNDTFSRYNFANVPPGDGAFIAKNSWGSSWGDDGYFYISYYDFGIGMYNAVFTTAPLVNYDHIYQYDPLGWVLGFQISDNTAWFRNDFDVGSNQQLSAVGFYTAGIDSQYEIYVYQDNVLLGHESGSLHLPGYHTIPLGTNIRLNPDYRLSVRVKLTTPAPYVQIPAENRITGYSSKATANASESFLSIDGVFWYDTTTLTDDHNTNVCLKAYTTEIASTPSYSLSLKQGWNLVSLPIHNDSLFASSIPVGCGVDKVAMYNGSRQLFSTYLVGKSRSDKDFLIAPDAGYFINCTLEHVSLTFSGQPVGSPQTLKLYPAWSLVGWPKTEGSTALTFGSLHGNIVKAASYDSTSGLYTTYLMGLSRSDKNFNMGTGKGYFVYANATGVVTVDI